jgi:predicted O-methyltransferase YrrM
MHYIHKLNKALWFVFHPAYYPHTAFILSAQISRWINPSLRARYKARADEWCAGRQVTLDAAITMLTGQETYHSIYDAFAEELDNAAERVFHCPVPMGGGGNVELVYQLAKHLKAAHVIETGVAYGWSSLSILLAIQSLDHSQLVSTDMPYPYLNNSEYVGCAVPPHLRPYWQIIRLPDRQAVPQALKILPVIDLCHYDSDKTYEGRAWVYPQLWRALRGGGIFISDDASDNFAFRDFCLSINQDPLIVKSDQKYIGIVQKSTKMSITYPSRH